MHQILQELQQGSHEVVKDNGDGSLEMRVKPPSALQLRAGRLIVQIINERDQVINANQHLAKQNTELLEEINALNNQIKELNVRLNSSPVPSTDAEASDSSNRGIDSVGETKATGSEAS